MNNIVNNNAFRKTSNILSSTVGVGVSKSIRFRDIALEAYWGHEFELSRSRDVIGHLTIR